jgi:hypothetical protein
MPAGKDGAVKRESSRKGGAHCAGPGRRTQLRCGFRAFAGRWLSTRDACRIGHRSKSEKRLALVKNFSYVSHAPADRPGFGLRESNSNVLTDEELL